MKYLTMGGLFLRSLALVVLSSSSGSGFTSLPRPRTIAATRSRPALCRPYLAAASPSLEAVTEDGGIVKSVVKEGKGEPLSNGEWWRGRGRLGIKRI